MRIAILALLILEAHFSLTALVPGPTGKGQFYWPFGPIAILPLLVDGVLPWSVPAQGRTVSGLRGP